jgi:hypothetical protein
MTDRIVRCLWAALLLVLVSACGGAKGSALPQAEYAAPSEAGGGLAMREAAPSAAMDKAMEADEGAVANQSAMGMPAPAPPPPPAGAVAQATTPTSAPEPARPEQASDVPAPNPAAVASPLLIYTAELNIAVYQTTKSVEKVEKLAREAGGYLVSRDDQSITVRVPAGKFQGTLGEITKLGDVLHRQVQVRDVTAEYTDLEIRLRNAEAVLARLTEMLQRASSVKDALQVEQELARVAGEVESLKGRLKLLRELVAFSTITIHFSAPAVETVESRVNLPFPWLSELGLSSLLRF